MEDCLFCKIVRGEIPSKKIYDGELVYGFEDVNPQAPVHYLLIPKKHIRDISDLEKEDAPMLAEMFDAAKKIAEEKKLSGSGFRTVINQGVNAGQAVFHLHLHILSGRKMGWPPG